MEFSEQSPLLSPDRPRSSADGAASQLSQYHVPVFSRRNKVLCGLFIACSVVWECGSILQLVPLNQILETNICRQLRGQESGFIDCGSDDAVQGELAFVRGWAATANLIPGILTAIPYGLLADRIGRKPVLAASLLGLSLTATFTAVICYWPEVFPARLIWLAPAFGFIGGSGTVLTSLLFSILSELAPDDLRSTMFSAFGSASLIVQIVMGSVSSVLMDKNPWIPMFTGIGLSYLSMLIALFLPETAEYTDKTSGSSLVDSSSNGSEGDESQVDEQDLPPGFSRWISATIGDKVASLRNTAIFLIQGNSAIFILLLTIWLVTFGSQAQEVILQLARRKFGWSWSKAAYIMPFMAAVVLCVLLIVLPTLNRTLSTRYSMSPMRKDLFVTRMSCAILLVASLLIGLSATDVVLMIGIGIWCMGAACNIVLRSLIAQLVEPKHRGMLFTTVTVTENIGSVLAGPVLASFFQIGLRLGWIWIGAPFLFSSILFLISTVFIYNVQVA